MEQLQLFTKLSYLPADLKSEVNDFIDFLLSKKQKNKKENTKIRLCKRSDLSIT